MALMKSNSRLDSRKVLREIQTLRSKLKLALQTGEDYKGLHTNILRLLKVIYSTKSEYKDVADYPQIRVLVEVINHSNGTPAEIKKMPPFPEKAATELRSALGIRLQELLGNLEAEYKLRTKLETNHATDIKAKLQNVEKEIAHLKAEVSKLSKDLEDIEQ